MASPHADTNTSRISRPAKRSVDEANKAKKKGHAGTYRMIHGSILLPRPWDEWHTPSGKVRMGAPRTMVATIYPAKIAHADDDQQGIRKGDVTEWVGDEVYLNDEDAWRLLGMDYQADIRHLHAMVERLDSVPSRCGKVWNPPRQKSAAAA